MRGIIDFGSDTRRSADKRGQITIEFVTIIALGLIVCISFCAYVLSELRKDNSREKYEAMEDIASHIQSEIKIASESVDGYNRHFSLPKKINSNDYSVNIRNNTWVSINSGSDSLVFNVNEFQGSISKENHIYKQDGIVRIANE